MPPAFLARTLPMATLVAVLLVGGARERPGGGRAQGRGGEPAPALPPVPRGGHRHHPAHRTFSATFNQFVIYVDEVSASQVRLKGLLVSDERNAEQSRIIVAREGRLLSDETNRRITLRLLDGSISESDVGDRRRFRQTYFSLYDMSLPVDSPLAAVAREEKPEKQLPLRELIKEAESMRRAGQIYAPYYVEL